MATDSPDPVNAGAHLTYSIIVSNSGPLSSISDTLTDAIPAGTTFVSATAPAGWTVTTPAVGGAGTVRWFLSGSFLSGGSATFGLVVAVDSSAVGTVENTATLTTGNVDAYQLNNSAHTSTTIGSVPPPPSGTIGGDSGEEAYGDPGADPNTGLILPRSGNDRRPAPAAGPAPTSGSPGASQAGNAGASPAGQPGSSATPAGASSDALDAGIERPTPNPFTGSMRMAYAVTGEAARVEIGVFDIAGRRMRMLAEGVQPAGRHSVTWDGRDESGAHVRKGMYFVRIQVGDQARQFRVASVN
jgi:uncharacterized repeat protein (TIGR01451 family)